MKALPCGAGARGKHGQDAGAAAYVQHHLAAYEARVEGQGVAVRLGARLVAQHVPEIRISDETINY